MSEDPLVNFALAGAKAAEAAQAAAARCAGGNPRAASIDWATRSLAAEGIEGYEHLAIGLVTAAERFDVPIELLIVWIHDRYPGKSWTVAAWVHWCCRYADALKRLDEYTRKRNEEEPNATTTPEHD